MIFNNIDLAQLNDKKMSIYRRKKFGFVFQFYNLIDNFTSKENISFPLELNGLKECEIDKTIKPISELLGISKLLNSYPYQLSGGEQQRIAIARALAINPEIIFADEPTGNLDSQTTVEILNLLNVINKQFGTTILMVTHDLNAAEVGNRIIKINDGKLI